jgi:multidrug efflux pump subunit AcrA (membrane-fusion protein)
MRSVKATGTLCGAASLMVLVIASFYFTALKPGTQIPAVTPFNPSLIPILSEVRGRIRKSYVAEGSVVHVGDPLVELDTDQLFRNKHALESRIHLVELGGTHAHVDLTKLYRELEATQLELNRFTITSEAEGEIIFAERFYPGQELGRGRAIVVLRQ